MSKIIPAPQGWTFHAASDWELNTGEPVHEVFPLFAFELSAEHGGQFCQAAGLFFEGRSHEISYTTETGPFRFSIGIYAPGEEPSTEEVEEALAVVKMTARRERKRTAELRAMRVPLPCTGHGSCDLCTDSNPCRCCGLTEEDGQLVLP